MAASVTPLACTTVQPDTPSKDDAPEVTDTKGVNVGNETVDDGIPCESHGCHDTLEEETVSRAKQDVSEVRDTEGVNEGSETVSRAKQDVSDAGNHITDCGASTDTQDLTNSSSTRKHLLDLITEGRVASSFLTKILTLILELFSTLGRPLPKPPPMYILD